MTIIEFKPPEGINFSCQNLVPIASLSRDLREIAAFLQDKCPYATLQRVDDWWQHDGLHFEKGTLDWHGLFAIVESPKGIYESMPGDDYVRIGVAASDGKWYLRFYATWDDEGEFLEGDYDITLLPGLADAFHKVIPCLEASIQEEASQKYFGRIVA
ncbi:MAG: hypothetical protein JXA42_04945 [Anaerolineales bacterium]|nr:hypothetical protein [Anaerolineales bacterium]